jgi:hypothetical protein
VFICFVLHVHHVTAFGENHDKSPLFVLAQDKKKSKVKQSHYTPWRRLGAEIIHSSHSFLVSALDGVSGQRHAPEKESPGTQWIGGCLGPTAGLYTEARAKVPPNSPHHVKLRN